MALRDLLSSLVSRPAGRLLEGSVRALVDDLIRDHDLASAAEVDSLRRNLRELDARAQGLQAGLDEAQGQVTALEAALAASDERLAEANARIEALRAEALRPPSTPATGAPPAPEEPHRCLVEGCTNKRRSKGFCSPHYQRWRRGTLPGFVRPDGVVVEGERRWRLHPNLGGKPYTIEGDKLLIEGKAY
ncbi:MAG: hypothetical protein ABIO70_25615 [Pseudomonadota bacterium]